MPPRFAYWTILAGGLPTAFRATEREELLPTFKRIQEKHPDAEMKYFARGRLWESREQAEAERATRTARPREPRGRDWRPGGDHRDPRQKFIDAKKERNLERRKDRFARKERPVGDRSWRDRLAAPKRDAKAGAPRETPHGDPLRAKAGPPRETPHGDPLRSKTSRPAGPSTEPWRDRPAGPAKGTWRDRPSAPKRDAKTSPPRERPQGAKPKTRTEWRERDRRPSGRPPGDRRRRS